MFIESAGQLVINQSSLWLVRKFCFRHVCLTHMSHSGLRLQGQRQSGYGLRVMAEAQAQPRKLLSVAIHATFLTYFGQSNHMAKLKVRAGKHSMPPWKHDKDVDI